MEETGFRKVKSDHTESSPQVIQWERETSTGAVCFLTTGEEDPAFLAPNTESTKTVWEKLDFIATFHCSDNFSQVENFVNYGAGLTKGKLAEIAIETKEADISHLFDEDFYPELVSDHQFQAEYQKQLMMKFARDAADKKFDEIQQSAKVQKLEELTPEELAEKTGLIDWNKLWEDKSELLWFIPNLLCAGRAHGFPAATGIGKSLLWQEAAAALASGREILGYPAQEAIRVLYLDHENIPLGDIKPRLIAMGFSPENLENFKYLSFPTIESLNTQMGGKTFIGFLDFFKPDLVFIDTFSRFVSGDENGAKVAHDFYDNTGRELKKRGIAYLRIDHVGKDPNKGARGSSAKGDDLDLNWTMSKTRVPNEYLLTNIKARVPVSTKSIVIIRESDPLAHKIKGGIDGVDWETILDVNTRHLVAVSLISEFSEQNPEHTLGQGKVWEALKDECKRKGITRSELFEALDAFKEEEEEQPLEEYK